MKRAIAIFVLASALFIVGGAYATSVIAARPASEFQMLQLMNGTPVRWTLPDGGQSGLFGTAPQCADLTGSGVSQLMMVSNVPFNLCVRPTTLAPLWDGGCNTTDTDINFGVPLPAWVPQGVLLDINATTICATTDAGVRMSVPLFRMY